MNSNNKPKQQKSKPQKQIRFNLSATSIDVYNTSQLQFYFQYITKQKPDTKTIQSFGKAGSVYHSIVEQYINNRVDIQKYIDDDEVRTTVGEYPKDKYNEMFNKSWINNNLHTLPDFRGQPLDVELYRGMVFTTLDYVHAQPTITIKEQDFLFDLIDTPDANIKIKGYIDAIDPTNHIIFDWKSNSSVQSFFVASKMYCYAYWKLFGVVPEKAVYYFARFGKEVEYRYTKQQLIEFEQYLKQLANEIVNKGWDIEKYEVGNYNGVFNNYKQACINEVNRRNRKATVTPIPVIIHKNYVKFTELKDERLNEILDKKFSYDIKGKEFSPKYRAKLWDGKRHLYSKRRYMLPLGLFRDAIQLVEEYNEYFDTNYKFVKDKDTRQPIDNLGLKYKTNPDYELRPYQNNAVEITLSKKIGVLEVGTGGGKSLIASELIRRIDSPTLLIINRIELVEQTAEMLEDYLGVEIGTIYEGEITKPKNKIMVASIQTLLAILKRDDIKEVEALKQMLAGVRAVIYDECHNVTNHNSYGEIAKHVYNAEYIIGLTGTGFRADEHTMSMHALVGTTIYKKTTAELVEEGYLTPTTCYFVDNEVQYNRGQTYADAYTEVITENEKRNQLVVDIVNANKGKKILVLTRMIRHGEILNELIDNSKLITSQTKKSDRSEDFADFKSGEYNVLIGSMQIFSTGINLPDLDVIINTSGNKTDIGTIQSIGRVMRKSDGKQMGYYYDFYDHGSRFFENAAEHRMTILEEYGHNVKNIKEYDIGKIDTKNTENTNAEFDITIKDGVDK